MVKKFTQEEVEKYYLDNGYELLSEYKNISTKNKIRNIETGKVYEQIFSSFKNGRRPENNVNLPITYEKFKRLVNNTNNYVMQSSSKEYKNKNSKLCIKEVDTGRKFLCNYTSFRTGHRGNVLTNEKKKEIFNYRKTYIENRGYNLLTKHYVPSKVKLKLCNKTNGNIFHITWNQFKQGYRDGNHYYSNEEISDIVSKDGYKLEYFSNVDNIHLTTPSGYKWRVSLGKFLRGTRCPKEGVSKSIGENILLNIFKKENISFYTQYKVIINEDVHLFDFVLPDYNLYIEYDGIQHFKPVDIFGGADALNKRLEKDRLKDTYCSTNGLTLIRIPYTCDNPYKIITRLNSSALPIDIRYDENYNYNHTLNYKDLFESVIKNGLSPTSRQTDRYVDSNNIKKV